ncbi:MAG TPA: YtxH domain-containing protein [Gemmatimonadota bacterium]|nr:YtxH domain-containing protein [Gemmatimonadota bacterium]
MNGNGGFLSGFLLGALTGAALAVLYAPEKGDKTRKKIVKSSGKWLDDASGYVGSAGDFVEKGRKRMGI